MHVRAIPPSSPGATRQTRLFSQGRTGGTSVDTSTRKHIAGGKRHTCEYIYSYSWLVDVIKGMPPRWSGNFSERRRDASNDRYSGYSIPSASVMSSMSCRQGPFFREWPTRA